MTGYSRTLERASKRRQRDRLRAANGPTPNPGIRSARRVTKKVALEFERKSGRKPTRVELENALLTLRKRGYQ